MRDLQPALQLLSSAVEPLEGRDRTRVTEVAPETSDEGTSFDVVATLPIG